MVSAADHPGPERGSDSTEAIVRVLQTVFDPELPVNIVDLGLVENVHVADDGAISVELIPTFVGCPALDMIRNDVTKALLPLAGGAEVRVTFINDPPWSPDRIADAGRAALKEHGVSVPDRATAPGFTELTNSIVHCPWCDSNDTQRESPFGPTRCRMIYYCPTCKNSFEHMKRLAR